MNVEFSVEYWRRIIQQPLWYREYYLWSRFIEEHPKLSNADKHEQIAAARTFFSRALEDNTVKIASVEQNMDTERVAIDTIVVHHTSSKQPYTLARLNAVHLLNIYVPAFTRPAAADKKIFSQRPIHSGHSINGRQVFWAYHWLLRMDGTAERLLHDSELGWHAGNWEVNKRSVAICLDNDYDDQDPSPAVIKSLAVLIKHQYPQVAHSKIIGHCEARQGTTCPGVNFTSTWKTHLLERLKD